MAIINRDTIKSWFQRGDKPTEEEFGNTWDSFWHKFEKIAMSAIDGLQDALNSKANTNHNHEISQVNGLEDALANAGGGAIEHDIIATVAGGGFEVGDVVPQGTTLTDYATMHIAPYVAPELNSLTISGDAASPFEVGQTFTVQGSQIYADNDSDGNPPANIKIVGNGFLPDTVRSVGYNAPDDPATVAVTITSPGGTATWIVTGEDKNGVAISQRSVTKPWYPLFKFGASPIEVVDNATAQQVYDALQQSWAQGTNNKTVTTTADNEDVNNYTYILYYYPYGDLDGIIQDGATPVLGAFTRIEGNITTQYGALMSVLIYKSNAKGAFLNGTSLAIS